MITRAPSTALLTLDSAHRQIGDSWNNFTLQRGQHLINSEATRIRIQEIRMPFFISNINKYNNTFWFGVKTGGSNDNYLTPTKVTLPIQFYTPTTLVSAVNNAIQATSGTSGNIVRLAYQRYGTPTFTFYCPKLFAIYWSDPYITTTVATLLTVPAYSVYNDVDHITPAYSVTSPPTTTTVTIPAVTSGSAALPPITLASSISNSPGGYNVAFTGLASNTYYFTPYLRLTGSRYSFTAGDNYIKLSFRSTPSATYDYASQVGDSSFVNQVLSLYSVTPWPCLLLGTVTDQLYCTQFQYKFYYPPALAIGTYVFDSPTFGPPAIVTAMYEHYITFNRALLANAAIPNSTFAYSTTLANPSTLVVITPATTTTTTVPGVTTNYPATTLAAGTTTVVPSSVLTVPPGPTLNTTAPSQRQFDAQPNFLRLLGFTNNVVGATPTPSATGANVEFTGDYTDFLYTRYLDLVSNALHSCVDHTDGNSSARSPGDIIARVYVADDCSVGNYVAIAGYANVGWNPSIIHRQFLEGKSIRWTPNMTVGAIDIRVLDEYGNLVVLPDKQFSYSSGAPPDFQIVLSVSED